MMTPSRKFLLFVSVAVLALGLLLSAGNYFLLDRSGRGQSLTRWQGQVEDRARLLAEPFAQAARRLEQARDDALARAEGQKREDSLIRYGFELATRPDGTTRPKTEGFDPQGAAGVFLPPGMTPDDDLKHRIVTMRDTLNLFGQSWLKEYPNLWFAGTEKWLVAYFPDYPWTEKLEAAFDPATQPWYAQAVPDRNAKLAPVWGTAKRDTAGKSLVASLSLPVLANKKLVGVIGQDVPLKRLIDAVAAGENETGVVRLVIDNADGIVAQTEQMGDILKAGAPLKADKKSADIGTAIEAVRAHGEGSGTILDAAGKRAIVYARVGTQPWTLVTLIPNTQLAGGTTTSALSFAGAALLGVLLLVGLVATLARRAVSGPMEQLARTESQLTHAEAEKTRIEAELKTVVQREQAAIQVTQDLARQLEDARRKTAELEAQVAAAAAAAAAASAADVTATPPPADDSDTIQALELDATA